MKITDVKNLTKNLPDFELPNEFDNSDAYLKCLADKGLAKRYPKEATENGKEWGKIKNRAEYELSLIIQFGFSNYFLIVQDFVNWAKLQGIPVGPGRGSVPSSIIAYALGITNIDPIKYNLLFERFFNPECVTMLDFDIDFGEEGRNKVIDYIKEKYGKKNVGKIITIGTDKKDGTKYYGIHAAGIVISKSELETIVPIKKDPITGEIIVQYEYYELENQGLIKFDLLSLKTLDLIQNTEKLIRHRGGDYSDFSIEKIPKNDSAAFAIFSEGNTDGIFQFESEKMKEILKQTKPDKMTDLMALNALFHPGLMEHIPQFIESKNGKNEIDKMDPGLKEILEETYGVIVYQEQIIQFIQRVTNYSLGKAVNIWRTLMKNKTEDLKEEEIGFDIEMLTKLFMNKLQTISKYSFNKSHTVAYAKLAYQSAYLKAHFPEEWREAFK